MCETRRIASSGARSRATSKEAVDRFEVGPRWRMSHGRLRASPRWDSTRSSITKWMTATFETWPTSCPRSGAGLRSAPKPRRPSPPEAPQPRVELGAGGRVHGWLRGVAGAKVTLSGHEVVGGTEPRSATTASDGAELALDLQARGDTTLRGTLVDDTRKCARGRHSISQLETPFNASVDRRTARRLRAERAVRGPAPRGGELVDRRARDPGRQDHMLAIRHAGGPGRGRDRARARAAALGQGRSGARALGSRAP